VWITNLWGASLTAVHSATGAPDRWIHGRSDHLGDPFGIVDVPTTHQLWVENWGDGFGDYVTVFNDRTGARVAAINVGLPYAGHLNNIVTGPCSQPTIAYDAASHTVWIVGWQWDMVFNARTHTLEARWRSASGYGVAYDPASSPPTMWVSTIGRVQIYNAATRQLITQLGGTTYGFDYNTTITYDPVSTPPSMWVKSSLADSITEIQASVPYTVMTTVSGSSELPSSAGVVYDGLSTPKSLWVVNFGPAAALTRINAVTGAFIAITAASGFHFRNPNAIALAGGHLWMPNVEGTLSVGP
jgi:hypothetical protein